MLLCIVIYVLYYVLHIMHINLLLILCIYLPVFPAVPSTTVPPGLICPTQIHIRASKYNQQIDEDLFLQHFLSEKVLLCP